MTEEQIYETANRKLMLISALCSAGRIDKRAVQRLESGSLAAVEEFAELSGVTPPWTQERRGKERLDSAIAMYRTDATPRRPAVTTSQQAKTPEERRRQDRNSDALRMYTSDESRQGTPAASRQGEGRKLDRVADAMRMYRTLGGAR